VQTLHVVGDSISQHYGPYLEQYLAGVFAYSRKEGLPSQPDEPNGANGGDSSLVLRYLNAVSQRNSHWDYLLLNCGLHDLRTDPVTQAKQVSPSAYLSNLQQIIPLARTLASRVFWVRTTPVIDAIHNTREKSFLRFAADVEHYNSIADGVMQQHGIPQIDLFAFTHNLGEDIYLDHVHFREDVRQLQAAFIAGYLIKTFDMKTSEASATSDV
jgi:lysophospholipase L1-like esterase